MAKKMSKARTTAKRDEPIRPDLLAKTDSSYAPITRVSDKLKINGYVVDSLSLDRIVTTARRALNPDFPDQGVVRITATPDGNASRLQFDDIHSALAHFDRNRVEINSVTLSFESAKDSQLEIAMESDGTISFSGINSRPDFLFHIDQLKRELQACDQRFPAFAKFFAFSPMPRHLIFLALATASVMLSWNVFYYFHALDVGVDVDPKVMPDGNKYFQEIETVLKSGTDSEKIDTILRGQFLRFTNVSSVLDRCRQNMIWSLVILGLGVASIFLIRWVRLLYPKTFFAFGPSVQKLQRTVRGREVLSVGIVIAFIVNVIAGIAVTVLSR